MPPTVRVVAAFWTVTVRLAFIATVPVPRYRSLLAPWLPRKVKLPFQFCGGFHVEVVIAAPLELSRLPPASVSPVFAAAALL